MQDAEGQGAESATNAMGQPLSLSLLPSLSKSSPFYGSSSALSFAKVIIAAALPNFSLASPEIPENSADGSRTTVYASSVEDATDLPMRSVADGMIENFFRRSHDIFRVLHRPTFMAEYDRVWLPGYEASTTFLALLNILFGLSCIFNKGVCTKESEKYYRRSVQLRRITSDAESVTLMEVQTLLLQCHYLQSTSSATRCWQTLSQAISAAYTLGLNCASSHITNPILRESHLRAWLACRNLDSVSASTFGRVPQISLSTASLVPMPAEVADDECITPTGIEDTPHTTTGPSRMSAFVWSGKIYAVMSHILQRLYVPMDIRGHQDTETVENEIMLSIESDLQELRQGLPSHLSIDKPVDLAEYADPSDWRLRQRVIIQNRPSLLRALKAKATPASGTSTAGATLASGTSASARQLCFECACEQIDLCYATTATQLDAPWFRRFCEENAGCSPVQAGVVR
ncbi:hypothetical protein P389DRAFT_189370 [Cystobasidium minutum MCA 4210]|uniref:uncharacterized protein n=1 Tax=Cystobasidium minutum MCA 4210 TaxID=1397322 RepID=UPI0034CE7DBC|eukprot:jgi/Rhomi1/189370/estExt_fgenesh1_pg.C_3_t20370